MQRRVCVQRRRAVDDIWNREQKPGGVESSRTENRSLAACIRRRAGRSNLAGLAACMSIRRAKKGRNRSPSLLAAADLYREQAKRQRNSLAKQNKTRHL